MKIVILHSADALEPPVDPVLDQIAAALKNADHETAFQVVLPDVVALATQLRASEPGLVVNLAEAFDGKSALESNVAALLNLLDLRYTGSSPAGLMLAGDKALSKKVLSFHGVKSPQFATVHRGDVEWAGDLSFPLIVKPPQEDASIGITHASVVHNVQELLEQMGEVQGRYHQPPLIEEFIDGREFYVGVIGNADARALPPHGNGFHRLSDGQAEDRQLEREVGGRRRGGRRRVCGHAQHPADRSAARARREIAEDRSRRVSRAAPARLCTH